MTYREATDYLFTSAPLFQNIGAGAYKEGLANTLLLDERAGHPHRSYRTVHVAGTNGKGSVCHTLAAALQAQGLRVGLYTSPHLVDFRERIRVDGEMIPRERVTHFVEEGKALFGEIHPSFFELATALALQHFAERGVDIAVIETGLGGRLDCTNIIRPELSVITNISLDHTQLLGDTEEKIAREKAGIIKPGVPALVGETGGAAAQDVFRAKALEAGSSLFFADQEEEVTSCRPDGRGGLTYDTVHFGRLEGALGGLCQERNTRTTLAAIRLLRARGIELSDEAVRRGFRDVCRVTGLMGRWQTLSRSPLTVCDTGHNPGGIALIARQLRESRRGRLHIVLGMTADKDVDTALSMLPKDAAYHFTQASVPRAMPAGELSRRAARHGVTGQTCASVAQAYASARAEAAPEDMIFVGGSTFVVADLLKSAPPGLKMGR